MKKLLFSLVSVFAIWFACTVGASAQIGNTVTQKFPGVPSGGCPNPFNLGLNSANGALSTCPNGSWVTSSSSATLVYASKVATLSTNLQTGGGTDDTTALENILKPGGSCANVPKGGIELVMDGPALVHGLTVCSNTLIQCQPGGQPGLGATTGVGGFYLANSSNVPVIALDSSSGTTTTELNVSVQGCFMNGNRANGNNVQQVSGTPNPCMQFYGIQGLVLENNLMYNCPFTGLSLSGNNIYEQNNRFEYTPATPLNTGGTDLRGPSSYVRIINETVCAGDDAVAANTRFYTGGTVNLGPFVLGGNISHVLMDGIQLDCPAGASMWGAVDLISDGGFLLDDVTVTHVKGAVQNYAVYISRDSINTPLIANGWIGDILVDDMDVTVTGPPQGAGIPAGIFPVDASIETLRLRNIRNSGIPDPLLVNFTANAYVNTFQTDFLQGNVAAGVFTQTSPSTVAVENFHWPNGNTLPPPWTYYNGNLQSTGFPNPPFIAANSVLAANAQTVAMLEYALYGNFPLPSGTQFSEITFGNGVSNAATAEYAIFRAQTPLTLPQSGTSQFNHYECYYNNGNVVLRKWVGNTPTALQTVAQALTIGDKLRGYANGTTVQCIYNGVVIASQTDATYSSGTVGAGVLSGTGNSSSISRWTGGSIQNFQHGPDQPNAVLPVVSGTGACLTITTVTGGSWAGSLKCTGTTGASTIIITPGTTAPNGWTVTSKNDITTPANSLTQSASTTTTLTLSGAAVTSGDVISWSATPY